MNLRRQGGRPTIRSGGSWTARFAGLTVLCLLVGSAAAWSGSQDVRYSPRLGIFYELKSRGSGYQVRLTAAPVPGSPLWQSQIQLEKDDTITQLDDRAITGPAEVENHYGTTTVKFINVRDSKTETRTVYLPPMAAPGVPAPGLVGDDAGMTYEGDYSPRLGIYYTWTQASGRRAVRVSADPVPGSPMAQDQAQIRRGDIILLLDDLAINTAVDLESHVNKTTVTLIRKDGTSEVRLIYLPEMSAPAVPNLVRTRPIAPTAPIPSAIPELFPLRNGR